MLTVAGGIVIAWLVLQLLAIIGDVLVNGTSCSPPTPKPNKPNTWTTKLPRALALITAVWLLALWWQGK